MTRTLPVLIRCEMGLGRLTARACGQRWAIAHEKTAPPSGRNQDTAAIKNSPCRTCEYGEQQLEGPLAEMVHGKRRRAPKARAYKPLPADEVPPASFELVPAPAALPPPAVQSPPTVKPRKHGGGRRRTGELILNDDGSFDEISRRDIDAFKAAKLAQQLKPKTINNYLTVLRKCLSVAVDWGLIDFVPKIVWLKAPEPEWRPSAASIW